MRKKLILLALPLVVGTISLSSCGSKKFEYNIELEGPNDGAIHLEGTSEGVYEEGYRISIKVTIDSDAGLVFDGFYIDDELVNASSTYVFDLTADTTITVKYSEASEESPDEPNNPDNPVNPPIDEDEIVTNAIYQHAWVKDDFTSDGGSTKEINGLIWNYDASTYLGFDTSNGRGVQIGSKNNPQTTPWKLFTSIPEGVYVTGYSLELANASGGVGTYDIKIGDYSKTDDFSYKEPTTITDEKVNKTGDSFELTLTSKSLAMYINNFEIYFYVPEGVNFEVSTDNGGSEEPDNPVNPPSSDDIPATKYKPITADEYYKDIDFNQSSAELFDSLSTKISTNITAYTYGEARYTLLYTDQVVGDSSHLYSLFDGDKLNAKWDYGATWNREHVWPKSKLGVSEVGNNDTNIATDLVNLRASCSNANSSHGNKYYGDTTTQAAFFPNISGGLSGNDHSYTGDHRGDVARICFFMALRYDDQISLSDDPSGSYQMGYLATLLKWNKEDPVDEFEIQRNNRIYEYQGNRNPFVDYNDLADKLF